MTLVAGARGHVSGELVRRLAHPTGAPPLAR